MAFRRSWITTLQPSRCTSPITIFAALKATPAKALGIVDRTWAIGELIDAALATQPIAPVPSAPEIRRGFKVIQVERNNNLDSQLILVTIKTGNGGKCNGLSIYAAPAMEAGRKNGA